MKNTLVREMSKNFDIQISESFVPVTNHFRMCHLLGLCHLSCQIQVSVSGNAILATLLHRT